MARCGDPLEIKRKETPVEDELENNEPGMNDPDVMPSNLWPIPRDVANLIADYPWKTPLKKPFLFSGNDYTFEKIYFLSKHAGSLDQFKDYVKKFLKKEIALNKKNNTLVDQIFVMNGMQGTLIELLVSQLDVSIKNETGVVMDKGMAECFLDIIKELLPERFEEVRKKAEKAAPVEEKEAKLEREHKNIESLETVFDAFKQDDEKVTYEAIEEFKTLILAKKMSFLNDQGYLTDNRYYMDLIHLIYRAFEVLARRSGELGGLNPLHDRKADRFCFEIIGTLELDLPPRMRQILKSRLYKVLSGKPVNRAVDIDGVCYRNFSTQYHDCSLGGNAYYDHAGCTGWGGWRAGDPGRAGGARDKAASSFQNLLRAITPVFNISAPQTLKESYSLSRFFSNRTVFMLGTTLAVTAVIAAKAFAMQE